jgi:hypothetical protein
MEQPWEPRNTFEHNDYLITVFPVPTVYPDLEDWTFKAINLKSGSTIDGIKLGTRHDAYLMAKESTVPKVEHVWGVSYLTSADGQTFTMVDNKRVRRPEGD